MNTAAPSRWQRVLQQCARHVEGRWPSRPAAEKPSTYGLQAGFLFSGQSHETVPRRLLLDNRLTPLERNAWQVFRLLLDGQGLVTPRYEDLQPYLSTVPYGATASRETVARVLTMLRLTRWLSLVARGRDQVSGRMQGSLYVLHDEPLTPAEAMELDQEYLELVGRCLSHASKVVRIVAQHVLEEIRQDADIDQGQLPTRLDTWVERWARQGLDQPEGPLHESERGSDHLVRNRTEPGSDAEPGLQPRIDHGVRHPNAACTVLEASSCTVPRASPAVDNAPLHWPDALQLSPNERHAATIALSKLKPADRQAVLNEIGARYAAGGIRKPAAYLMGLIQRALRGEFHPWAGQVTLQPPVTPAASLPPRPPRTQGEPISPLAQACLDELRQLRGNHPGRQ
ncbi:STY4528 family pathogenicity island replication protein [Pseudomonas sp. GD03721]|nr:MULTISPECIES: STY4528 family pathogenicity island replication protein [unclassified Pseudomonas]MDH1440359.1 STY4528 family pathogenicity island replication protein [Pseudomonas sp. GD03722]WGG03551.1 STY4528 family pathogenicity island replication protein [Pseudomonas sp. GD03721]WGG07719.1 STY4528 family pathogenicity island replication protein [Pseudomonas sp. GD03919]